MAWQPAGVAHASNKWRTGERRHASGREGAGPIEQQQSSGSSSGSGRGSTFCAGLIAPVLRLEGGGRWEVCSVYEAGGQRHSVPKVLLRMGKRTGGAELLLPAPWGPIGGPMQGSSSSRPSGIPDWAEAHPFPLRAHLDGAVWVGPRPERGNHGRQVCEPTVCAAGQRQPGAGLPHGPDDGRAGQLSQQLVASRVGVHLQAGRAGPACLAGPRGRHGSRRARAVVCARHRLAGDPVPGPQHGTALGGLRVAACSGSAPIRRGRHGPRRMNDTRLSRPARWQKKLTMSK